MIPYEGQRPTANEQRLMERYLNEVKLQAGVERDTSYIEPYDDFFLIRQNPTIPSMGALAHSNAIHYVPGVTEYLTGREIKASLAHELGHHVLGHTKIDPTYGASQKAIEYAADEFAARSGYGEDFIAFMWTYFLPQNDDTRINKTHPTRPERERRIREVMNHERIYSTTG